ncbi:hypothetical protein Glove_8g88 [Diversispora epigaea]|uniref:Uncharacterized protein n=1 Tax=Diversispora epigaea TaxID=1348612 RepID=A0A397JQX3_9GLOM|nr:hypothetical protein Glove_8g88 [Diversispora epigaea]
MQIFWKILCIYYSNFEINPNFIREQQCHFTWNKQEIDAGIKEFVKKKDEIESTTTWFLQHRINNWLNKNIINETNWKWSIETWHETKITNNKTNSKENSLRAFSLKLLNEELPTMATLHTRKPNIYTSTECPFCKKYKETNSHIFMCANYGKILKSTFRSIIKRIYIKEKGNIGLHDLMSKITRGHFLKINYHRQILGTQPSDRFEFNDLVKGLIPKSIYRLIRKKVNSTETGKNMVMEIFCSWKRTLYSRWKNRCKDFLNWEIKNDIGESDKKSKGKKPYIDYTYLERKKHLYDIGIDIKNFIINSVYKNNVDILSNIFFCLDVENHEKGLNFIDNQIIPTRPSEAVRYLGVWVQENGKKTYQKKLIDEKIHQTVSIMIRKRLTDKQSRYIINHVLFLQVKYLLSDYVYLEKGLEKLNAKIRMVFKRSCGHTSKLPNSILYSSIGYKLFCLQRRQLQVHATELVNRINKEDLCSWTTKVRLQKLQDYMWTTTSIWDNSTINKFKARNKNLTGEILRLLAKHDIEIQINGKLEFPVIVRGGVIDIESFMGSDIWYHKHRDSLRKYGVLYIEQLLNSDLTRVLELKRIHQYEIPRKNLTWYEELRVKIEENIDNIRNKLGRNPINRLTLLGDNTKIKGKFVTTDYPSGPIMGKVTREPKEQRDLLNEQADKLAKLGVNSGSNFEINPNFIREQQCHFTWNKQEIDAGIKEFVKKKDEIESTTTWFLQHRINNWLNKNIINETNWKWSIETWHETKITNNKTNSKENSLRAFSLKLLNEELPTMATLHTRKPNIYTSTECPFCKKYKETNSHIFMCADYGKILKSTFRSIIKRIYIKEKGNIGLHDLMSKITRGHFLKINYHRQILGTQPSDRFEFNDLVKGLIPKSIYRLIRKKVNSTETGKNMVMEIFCSWKRTLYSRWKNRCKDFLNWEIKNDIGESDKKSKDVGGVVASQ